MSPDAGSTGLANYRLLVTESREVRNFDRVTLRDCGDLVITRGEEKSLTILGLGNATRPSNP